MLEQLKIFFHANCIPLCFYGIIGILHVSWCHLLRSYQEDKCVTKKDYLQITESIKGMGDQINSMRQEQEEHRRRQTDDHPEVEPMSASLLEEMNERQIDNMRLNFRKTCNDLMRRLTSFQSTLLKKPLEEEKTVETEITNLKAVVEKYENMFDTFYTQLGVVKEDAGDSFESMQMRCESVIKTMQEAQQSARQLYGD